MLICMCYVTQVLSFTIFQTFEFPIVMLRYEASYRLLRVCRFFAIAQNDRFSHREFGRIFYRVKSFCTIKKLARSVLWKGISQLP